MARDERFKLLYYPHIDRTQLFDLKNDPYETNDLLLPWRRRPIRGMGTLWNPGYAPVMDANVVDGVVEQLRGVLDAWQTENGAFSTFLQP